MIKTNINKYALRLVTGEIVYYKVRITMPNDFWSLQDASISTVALNGAVTKPKYVKGRLEVNPLNIVWNMEF